MSTKMDLDLGIIVSVQDPLDSEDDDGNFEYVNRARNVTSLDRTASRKSKSVAHQYPNAQTPPASPMSHATSLKRLRFVSRSGSKEKLTPHNLESIAAIESLMRLVNDRIKRNDLVHSLLVQKSDASVRVRFLAAVKEFEDEKRKVDKKSKGRKIVSLFIQNGSMFQLHDIPQNIEDALLASKLDVLVDLKELILEQLCRNPAVINTMREMGEKLPEVN